MRRDEIETSITNFLNGSGVDDVDTILEDFMNNVIDADDEDMTDEDRARIKAEAREILEGMAPSIDIDSRVEGGKPDTDDHDTGIVLDLSEDGSKAFVGWDSGVQTWTALAELRRF